MHSDWPMRLSINKQEVQLSQRNRAIFFIYFKGCLDLLYEWPKTRSLLYLTTNVALSVLENLLMTASPTSLAPSI